MWEKFVKWAKKNLLDADPPLANLEDINTPQCVNTADEAIARVREHCRQWQDGRER